MRECEYCGRMLSDDEVCTCTGSANQTFYFNESEYFKITIDKEKIAGSIDSLKQIGIEGSDYVVHAADNGFETGLPVVDNCVVPADDEIPVRQYDIARLSTPFIKNALGRLQITSKRVIFRAAGRSISGPILTEKEFDIKEIGGVDMKVDYRFSWVQFLLVYIWISLVGSVYNGILFLISHALDTNVLYIISFVLLLIAMLFLATCVEKRRCIKAVVAASVMAEAIVMATSTTKPATIIILSIIAGLFGLISFMYTIFAGIVDDLYIVLQIKGAHSAIEIARQLVKDERSGFMFVKPWKDTELAIRELGAIISDLRLMKTEQAVEKWKK